jgi:hypothetical protein
MGRLAEVSDEDILEAGRALDGEGKSVNGWSLRSRLGRGKPERLFAVWKAHAPAEPSVPDPELTVDMVLPPKLIEYAGQAKANLTANLDGFCVSAYRLIEDAVNLRYKADLDRLSEEHDRMEAELQSAATEVERLDSALDDALEKVRDLASQLEETQRDAARAWTSRPSERKTRDEDGADLSRLYGRR